MAALLESMPGARRALFRHYHIGGCASCGFSTDETLAEVCARNGGLDTSEVTETLRAAAEEDARLMIEPSDVASHISDISLVDVRTAEEFDAVHIAGSRRLDQALMQEMLATWGKDQTIVLIDHDGSRSLDAAAYFTGHGLTGLRCLRGGIDAWSVEIDPTLPRYTLE